MRSARTGEGAQKDTLKERTREVTFDRYRLDLRHEQLWCGEQEIPLPGKAFAVLCYLVEHAGQLVSKAELFSALWPGTVVGDNALAFWITALRKALGDKAKTSQLIETVHRRGYRFIGKVVSRQQGAGSSGEGTRDWGLGTSSSASQAPSPKSLVPYFVGRASELQQLHYLLDRALNGERQLIFVTGAPGIGKTTLVNAFLQTLDDGVWVTRGHCVEQYGPGEPYMPILEALGRLCRAPGGERLIVLLQEHAPTWLVQMPALLSASELVTLRRRALGATQQRMLRELAEALDLITQEHPLVLWLEDLHWSDPSTVTLLALLARRPDLARLLVIGSYRPVDVAAAHHPLQDVVSDLRAHQRCQVLQLTSLTEEAVADYIRARFPQNLTPVTFAHTLHQQTEGHPFFLNSLLNDLIARHLLIEADGTWVLAQDLTTVAAQVPASVQQLLARQQRRLQPMEQRVLEAASLAGHEFAVGAVAAALATDVAEVGERSAELARQQQFIEAAGVATWPDGTVSTRYRFHHALYQQLWHERVSLEHRQQWHIRIGERLEAAYGQRAYEIASELAVHFEQGRDYRKAVQYLVYAGQQANQRSAHAAAISLLTRGLELLKTLPDSPERTQHELTLRIALGTPLVATKSWASPDVERHFTQTRELCQQLDETQQLFWALTGQWAFYALRAEHTTARALAEQLLNLAQKVNSQLCLVYAHAILGFTLFFLGELTLARDHMEQCTTLYDPQTNSPHVSGMVNDPKVQNVAFAAWSLGLLGYPDHARTRIHEALTLARELAHPYSLAYALAVAARLAQFQQEPRVVQQWTEELIPLARTQGFPHWLAEGRILRGWAVAAQGQRAEGMAQIRQGLAAWQAAGLRYLYPYFLLLLAESCGQGEGADEALSIIVEAQALVEQSGEQVWEAELYRLKGTLTLEARGWRLETSPPSPQAPSLKPPVPSGAAQEAAGCFLKAIDVARKQQAKSLELRAVMSLVRLRQRQAVQQGAKRKVAGKRGSVEARKPEEHPSLLASQHPSGQLAEAHHMLTEVYNWFTEGFDTKDLQEAKTLIEDLSHCVSMS
jgi:predicted ATPase/DNA-binding winged helix-turn-helix (wHTH) protein